MFLPQALTTRYKKIVTQLLLHYVSICISSKQMPQIFKIIFHTGYKYFCPLCCHLPPTFSNKNSFSSQNPTPVETETHFSREVVKVLKEIAVADRIWSSVKLF